MTGLAPDRLPLAAVTGASSFLCRALERQLTGRARIRGLFRSPGAMSEAWTARGHEVVFGDIEDETALAGLVTGADVVYHCAARMGKDDPALSHRVNVDGTAQLARLSRMAGVRRLVYVSSISVYAATPSPTGVITEETLPANVDTLNPYSRTKHGGEMAVRALAERGDGPPFTILRPTSIYGPWSRSWFLDWVGRLQKVPVVVGGNVPVDVVHVEDVARALIQAAESPAAVNEVLHIGHHTVTLQEFGVLVGGAIGQRVWRLPGALDWVARHAVERLYRVVKGSRMSMSLTHPVRYPHTRAERVIGYAPRVSLEEGFAELGRWYREQQGGGSREEGGERRE